MKKLRDMGFDVNSIPSRSVKVGVIAGGDIFITNVSIETTDNQKQTFLRLVKCNRVGNIRIKNNLKNKELGRGFRRGIDLWNIVNGNTLRLIPVNNNPDIVVRLSRTPIEISG